MSDELETVKRTFSDLKLRPELMQAIKSKGYVNPSPIQKRAIPSILDGRDLIAQAQTGSGKTAAFVIPALEKLQERKGVEVLVLVPTRELCKQVVGEFEALAKFLDAPTVAVVGGESPWRQIEMINRGAKIIVATPGRILDHLSAQKLKRMSPRIVILDEADEMLDMGFIEDIKKIISFMPDERQTLLFSATMPSGVKKLANSILREPEHICLVEAGKKHQSIEQRAYLIKRAEREDALIRLIQAERPEKTVIFCRTRADASELSLLLAKENHKAVCLHGELGQNERNRVTDEFRRGYATILVATDVASRGLDIDDLSHVINYHVAENLDRYTHRIGRTGRAGQKGMAISLLTPEEVNENIFLKQKIRRNELKLCNIPNKKQVQQIENTQFHERILATEIAEEAEALLENFASEQEAFDYMLRLYSYARQNNKIKGPSRIGFNADDWERLEKMDKRNFKRGRKFARDQRQGPNGPRRRNQRSSRW